MKDPYFIWSSDVSSASLENVGKLAKNLAELKINDIAVQNFFVLNSKKFVEAMSSFFSEIQGQINSINIEDVDSFLAVSKNIQSRIDSYEFDEDFKIRLLENYRELEKADSKYSELSDRARELIKSGRDLPSITLRLSIDKHICSSEAIINLRGMSELIFGIKEIWKNLFSVKSLYLMKKKDILISDLNPGIIFQKTLLPSKSGDIFTSNPINSNNSQHYIQAHWGMNNDFIEIASSYIVSKEEGNVAFSRVEKQEEFVTKKSLGSDKFVQRIPEKYQNSSPLSEKELIALSKIASKIESVLDYPQHINWVVFDKKLIIVKSEPITNVFKKPISISDGMGEYITKGIGITNLESEGVYYKNFVFDKNAIFQVNFAKKSFDPYLILSSGVISKSRSISSYLAISCQELDVPCLINADTSSLSDGQRIRISGSCVFPVQDYSSSTGQGEAGFGFSSSEPQSSEANYDFSGGSDYGSETSDSDEDEEEFSFETGTENASEQKLDTSSETHSLDNYSSESSETGSYSGDEHSGDYSSGDEYSSSSSDSEADEGTSFSEETSDSGYETPSSSEYNAQRSEYDASPSSEYRSESSYGEENTHREENSLVNVARKVEDIERIINDLVVKSAEKRRTSELTEKDEKDARILSEAEWIIRDLKKKLSEI